jgi:hypothetical protein
MRITNPVRLDVKPAIRKVKAELPENSAYLKVVPGGRLELPQPFPARGF